MHLREVGEIGLPGLQTFDGVGRPYIDRPLACAEKVVSAEARGCAVCAGVRARRVDDYLAERTVPRNAHEGAISQWREERARAGFRFRLSAWQRT